MGRSSAKSASTARSKAIETVQGRDPVHSSVDFGVTQISEVFGSSVFNRSVMKTLLPRNVYKALSRCLDHGEQLDPSMADVVANAMKDWAISKGATHFTHWFHPMTGLTAEKHDAFLGSGA